MSLWRRQWSGRENKHGEDVDSLGVRKRVIRGIDDIGTMEEMLKKE